MSFRLIFEALEPGQNRFGSDRHATAEWRHCLRFKALCHEDFETDLSKDAQKTGSLDHVETWITLVIEAQRTERVLPSVFVYPGEPGSGSDVARIEAFVHVPASFFEALAPEALVVAKIAFRQDRSALFEMDGGDRLGHRCSIREGNNVVIETAGGA